MPKPTDYDKTHLRNMAAIGTRIDRIFKKAAEEAAKIGVSIKTPLPEDRIFSFDDYPATKKQIERLMTALQESMETTIVSGVRSAWTLSNNKNNALVSRIFGDRIKDLSKEQYRRYFTNNAAALEAFLQRKNNGLNLSDRVWRYTDAFRSEIELGLDLGIRSGKSAAQMTRSLQQYLQHPDTLFRRVRDEHGILRLSQAAANFHPGRGVYRSSYRNARRLAATETNIAYRTSDHLRWQQMDFIVGIEIKLSNNHTLNGEPLTDICDTLAGRYPKDFKFTGWHPLCRCHAVTILKTEEEMAEDTQRILAGEEPLPPEESSNAVKDVPRNFADWVDDNRDRIENAHSLPYFIRDNSKYFRDIGEVPEPQAQSSQKGNGEASKPKDSYIGKKIVERSRDYIIGKRFANLETTEQVASTLKDLLCKRLGYDIEVIAEPEFIDLATAKAYATELERLSRQYQLRQGKLATIRLGYHTTYPNEYGAVLYNPYESVKKTISLRKAFDIRYPDKAIDCSRCDEKNLSRSTATHEFGHLLYQFRDKTSSQDILFETKVIEIYDSYRKEVMTLIKKGDMNNLAELYIGNYADVGVGEFMAEAFQEYKNCLHPSKYAMEIGKLIDKWFKR